MRNIVVLGSTGSIGISTLNVIRLHLDKYRIYALSANQNVDTMYEQCLEFAPVYAAMADEVCAKQLKHKLSTQGVNTTVLSGNDAINTLAEHQAIDTVVAGIVGAIGLLPTIAAVKAGKIVLVANKEPLVMLGHEILLQAKQYGATVLPVDSEHNAIFQCMPNGASTNVQQNGIEKILLTGSGGPFRTMDKAEFSTITPAQACAHPNWDMGRKISVDSATMMNKGLELIEACALFDVPADFVQIVVHPQSVIHSMVQYTDGSILAQMGVPDMKIPIAHALGWPDRVESGAKRLDLFELAHFDFEPADEDKFPALRLARIAAQTSGTLSTILNAANEVVVQAFLDEKIRFDQICTLIETAMDKVEQHGQRSLERVLETDAQTRQFVSSLY